MNIGKRRRKHVFHTYKCERSSRTTDLSYLSVFPCIGRHNIVIVFSDNCISVFFPK